MEKGLRGFHAGRTFAALRIVCPLKANVPARADRASAPDTNSSGYRRKQGLCGEHAVNGMAGEEVPGRDQPRPEPRDYSCASAYS